MGYTLLRLLRKFVSVILCLVVTGSNVNAQAPKQARLVAEQELAILVERITSDPSDTVFGRDVSASDLSTAVLGEAYVSFFWIGPQRSMTLDLKTILETDDQHVFCFPVICNGQVVGTVNIGADPDGQFPYAKAGRNHGSPFMDRIVELHKQYPSESGYSISKIYVKYAGNYTVISKGSNPILLMPIGKVAARTMSMEPRDDFAYPLLQADQAVAKIKAKVQSRVEFYDQRNHTEDH